VIALTVAACERPPGSDWLDVVGAGDVQQRAAFSLVLRADLP
jgi:hypothetical protein